MGTTRLRVPAGHVRENVYASKAGAHAPSESTPGSAWQASGTLTLDR